MLSVRLSNTIMKKSFVIAKITLFYKFCCLFRFLGSTCSKEKERQPYIYGIELKQITEIWKREHI